MSGVVVITDSTASLPPTLYEQYGMIMVPYYVHFSDHTARDLVDIQGAAFCRYLAELSEREAMPRTANPSPGNYVEAFVDASKRSSEVVSFHMTSQGSGAYQAALLAKEMVQQELKGVRIEVVDTRNVSMCHGWMALQAARAAAQGVNLDGMLRLVRRLIPVAQMLQTADTLRYLYLGGRIGRAKHLVGSLLQIKPVVSMEQGIIVTKGVARTRSSAYRKIADLVESALEGTSRRIHLALTHAAAEDGAAELLRLVRKVAEPAEVLFCELSPALTVHSGPGTVGLCYVPEMPQESPA